ncbi:MAG: DUF87 domain-containing protein [Emcibacter sp.]|nr:DUF87 domain-containing protein [Emcibacter sp.]
MLENKMNKVSHSTALNVAEQIGFVTYVNGREAVILCDIKSLNKIRDTDDQSHLPAGQIGAIIKIKVNKGFVFATVREISRQEESVGPVQHVLMHLDYLGQGIRAPYTPTGISFERGIKDFPVPGQSVYEVSMDDLESIFGANDIHHFHIGTVFPQHVTPVCIKTDSMLGKHFAVLGSTGTGKSCTVALIIHRLVERMPNGHIIILDPHNEYKSAFEDCGEHFSIANLRLPYWMMNFEEHVEMFIGKKLSLEREVEIDILRRCIYAARVDAASNLQTEKITVNSPIPYKLSFLSEYLDKNMGMLNNPEKLTPFLRLKTKIEELRRDVRFSFMFSGLLAHDNLKDVIKSLLRFPVAGKPVATIDLSGVPSEIVNVVVSMISRLVFDFAVWSKGENSRPILLVCEEAHRYVPTSENTAFNSARKAIERIAKEGRKYGVSLGLVSQRPADVSESALSQCGTIFAMRMNNERDQKFVEHVMPEGNKGTLAALSSLQNREALVVGEGVTAPTRVLLDKLDDHKRPSGDNPEYSEDWQKEIENDDFIADTIKNWRNQGR